MFHGMCDVQRMAYSTPSVGQATASHAIVRIRWHELQDLMRERDVLWHAASGETRSSLEASWSEYGRDFG
jgi:hypothetical protein